jgi:hypothetical protein
MHLSSSLVTRLRFHKKEDKEKLINTFVLYFGSSANEKELREILEKMSSLNDLDKVEKIVFEKITTCLNHFTFKNSVRDERKDWNIGEFYLGFGKGSKLTTVIRAFEKDELRDIKVKKSNIENIWEPTTIYQNGSQGVTNFSELRKIGLCLLKAECDEN